MRNLLRAIRPAAAAVLLGLAALLPAAALADWSTNGCSSCHDLPPNIASSTAANCAAATPITIGINESFMSSQADFLSHVQSRGTACSVPQMSALSGGNATDIYDYLLSVRDGSIGGFSPGWADTAVGSFRDDAVSFTVRNYRNPAMGYSVSATGDYSIVSHTASGTGCSAGSVPGATTLGGAACTVNLTIRFTPAVAGTRSGSVSVIPTSNSGVAYASRTVNFTAVGYVPTPIFARSPSSLSLIARLGSSDSGTVTVSNSASATANVVLGSLTFSGTAGVFTRGGTCNSGTTLSPGSSCSILVTYTPTAAGAQNGTLAINHNGAGSPAPVTLTATGTQSLIGPTSNTIAFGNVQQGVPRLLTQQITNTGTATLNFQAPLPSSAGARTGAAAGDYAVSGCAASLAPGASCTLNVTLTPSALGARPATLTIASDATNGPAVFTLTGTGVALPEPSIAPTAPADFPDTVIGQAAAQLRTVTVTNDRTRDVGLTVASITDFEVAGGSCGAVVVGGGGSCTVQLRFRPAAAGGESRRTGSFVFDFTGTSGDPDPDPINVAVAGNALLPLQVSSTTVNAAAVVGSPTTSTVVLTNRASSALTLSALAIGGAQAADYSLDAGNTCTTGLVMAASSSCNLVVRFNPPTAGTRNATLTITHTGSAGSPQTIAYNGTATPAPQGRIELSAASLAFADTQLASTSTQSVIVRNTGNLALNFAGFAFSGTHAAEYSRAGTCAVGTPIPIAGECTLAVTFAPAALGLRTASLTITSDASNGAAVLALSGTGVPIPVPVVSLTPATLEFGEQTLGGLYPVRRVRLANVGTADLAVGGIAVSGTGFADASAAACPAVLVPGAGCDIDIAFAATEARLYTGAVTVTSNAAGSPHTSGLRGTGVSSAVPVLTWSPLVSTLDFGSVSAGSVSPAQTVTVLNQGPGGVTLTVLNAVGPDAASFSVVGGTCSLAAPLFEDQTCTVDVVFAPGSAGTKTAQVQIASTGSFPPTLTLTGTGLAGPNPSFAVSTAALDLGSARVGAQSLPGTVRLVSSGTGLVTVTAMATDGPYSILSTTCPTMPFSLPAGTECAVSVIFAPTDEGTSAGTLRITTDASPAVREVALAGNGTGAADVSDGGGGGCAIGDGSDPFDPTLWLLLLAALAGLGERERRRRGVLRPRRDPSGAGR